MAFPDFYTVPDGGWHITVCEKLGIIKQGLVPGGHAAVAFIHKDTGHISYADCGRYTAPRGRCRLRTQHTDPDVMVDIRGEFDAAGQLVNKEEILHYFDARRDLVQSIGTMFASFCDSIHYEKARAYLSHLENEGNMPYNAFGKNNINCARFVRRALLHSVTDKKIRRRLKYTVEPTPCPLGNVKLGASSPEVYRLWKGELAREYRSLTQLMIKYFFTNSPNEHNIRFRTTNGDFEAPECPEGFPGAQWLGGLTCGAWFHIEQPAHVGQELYRIRKIMSNGKQIFDYLFEMDDEGFDINQPFEVVYDCTALFCTLVQDGRPYVFDFKKPYVGVGVY